MPGPEDSLRDLLKAGDQKRAKKLLRALQQSEPDSLETKLLAGLFYKETGQPKRALKHFKAAIDVSVHDHRPWLERAEALKTLDEHENAAEDLKKAALLAPDDPHVLERLSGALMDLALYREAIEPLEKLWRAAPDNLKYSYNIGYCLLHSGQYAKARPIFEVLIKAAPAAPDLLMEFSILLDRMGEPERGFSLLRPFAEKLVDRTLARQAADLLESAGKLQDAADLLKRLCETDHDDIRAYVRAARVAIKLDRKKDQEHYLNNLLRLTEGELPWAGIRIWTYVMLGDLEKAFQVPSDTFNILPWQQVVDLAQQAQQTEIPTFATPQESGAGPGAGCVILAACDHKYFELYSDRLIRSARANSPTAHVHIHVICTDETQRLPPVAQSHVSVTSEVSPGASKTLFACRRLTLVPSLLREYRLPVICVDVDVHINADLTPLIQACEREDALVYLRPDSYEYNRWAAAGLTVFCPTRAGLHVAQFVSDYCEHFIGQGDEQWYLDQMALGAAYVFAQQPDAPFSIGVAPAHALDFEKFKPSSLVWAAKGWLELPPES